jgi:hypothetical protein
MKTNLQKISYWASVSVIGIIIGISLQFTKAWTEPTATAPGGNIGAPITTGNVPQTKGAQFIAQNHNSGYFGSVGWNSPSDPNADHWGFVTNGSIWAGEGLSVANGSINGTRLYKCPLSHSCDNGTRIDGSWASYGCDGQISQVSYCVNVWWGPAQCSNACTPL